MHKEYLKKIMENTDNLSKDEIYKLVDKYGCLMEKTMDHIKDCDEELYEEIEDSLYEMAYGKVISEEMAKRWVSKMEPFGEKWTLEETTEVLRKNNLSLNPIDFYVVLNMMYNDYGKTIGDDTTMYIKLARDWLKDEDAKEHKLYNYYKYVVG